MNEETTPAQNQPQTTDEMAELWIQVVADNDRDLARLTNDARDKAARDNLHAYTELLRGDPRDAKVHAALGRLLFLLGRMEEGASERRGRSFAASHCEFLFLNFSARGVRAGKLNLSCHANTSRVLRLTQLRYKQRTSFNDLLATQDGI